MTRASARVASSLVGLGLLGALVLGWAGPAAAQPRNETPPEGDVQDPYAGEPEDPYGAPSETPAPAPRPTPAPAPPAAPRATPPAAPRPPAPAPPTAPIVKPPEAPAVRPGSTPGPMPRSTPATATPDVPAPSPAPSIDEAVARALYERARVLSDAGDFVNAKMLLQESLSRSSDGPASGDARSLLAVCEENLGDLPYTGDADTTLDPFATRDGKDTLDPYADDSTAAAAPDTDLVAGAIAARDRQSAQRTLAVYGGLYGFTAGMAVASADTGDAALLGGLVGAGAGIGAAYLLNRTASLSSGQASTIAWSGAWAGLAGGILVDLSGIGTSTSEGVTRGVAVGGLLGTGAGWMLASKADPAPGDVALINSLGMYGTATSLLMAVGLAPVEVEGYSLNALLGAGVGIGIGIFAAPRIDVSRQRMLWVDLGAALGAATPWVLIYPAVSDGSSESDQQIVGVLSAVGLLAGGYLAWRLTADMDQTEIVAQKRLPAVSGLLQHGPDGAWAVGVPMPRLPDSALGPRAPGFSVAVDLLAGEF
jgi:hypothetical protein